MSISTGIYHLQELPDYGSEKPYTMRYVPEGTVPVTNVQREQHMVTVDDMRHAKCEYTLDRNGFMVADLHTETVYEDFDNKERIEQVYFAELRAILSKQFPESNIDFVSYLVISLVVTYAKTAIDNVVRYVSEMAPFHIRQGSSTHSDSPILWLTLMRLLKIW
jgi:hypothetical protein